MVRAGAKMLKTTFISFDICHRMEPVQKSYSVIQIHNFKVKIGNSY